MVELDDLLLDGFHFREVLDDSGKVVFLADDDLAHSQPGGKQGAVFSKSFDLPADADYFLDPGAEIIMDITIMVLPVRGWHQDGYILT